MQCQQSMNTVELVRRLQEQEILAVICILL